MFKKLFERSEIKEVLVTILLTVIAFFALSATGWLALLPGTPSGNDGSAALAGREVISAAGDGAKDDDRIIYSYVGAKLPEKLAPDEVVEKRTENSWSRLLGREGADVKVTTVFYMQQAFVKRADGWHYVEYARASKKALDHYEATKKPFSSLFFPVAYADYTTTPFAGSGDGYVAAGVTATSTTLIAFNTAQGTTTGSSKDNINPTDTVGVDDVVLKSESVTIYRGFLPFDTSSIPSNATITSATLNVYGTTTGQTLINDGSDYITVVQTSQSSATSLTANTDYIKDGSSVTNPTEGIDTGQRKDLSSLQWAIDDGSGLSALNTFTLNATGRGWIKKSGQSSNCGGGTGVSCFGLREGHDTTRTLGSIASNTHTYASFVASDYTGTNFDPYLSVTYTLPFAFWQFQDY